MIKPINKLLDSSGAVGAVCGIAGLKLACASRRRACQSHECECGTVAWWRVRQSGSIGLQPTHRLLALASRMSSAWRHIFGFALSSEITSNALG
jgi:hypothetical protein